MAVKVVSMASAALAATFAGRAGTLKSICRRQRLDEPGTLATAQVRLDSRQLEERDHLGETYRRRWQKDQGHSERDPPSWIGFSRAQSWSNRPASSPTAPKPRLLGATVKRSSSLPGNKRGHHHRLGVNQNKYDPAKHNIISNAAAPPTASRLSSSHLETTAWSAAS